MKFVVDGMLGRLVRWLRLSGHDVLYARDLGVKPAEEDEVLIQTAKSLRRILLTSDVGLYRRGKKFGVKCVLLRGDNVVEQLVELSRFLGRKIKIDFEKSRCPLCNGALREVGRKDVEGQVPASVLIRHERFWLCKRCGKVYWEGKHWKSIIEITKKYEGRIERAIA